MEWHSTFRYGLYGLLVGCALYLISGIPGIAQDQGDDVFRSLPTQPWLEAIPRQSDRYVPRIN